MIHLILLTLAFASEEPPKAPEPAPEAPSVQYDPVLVLNKDTVDNSIKANPYLLVEFYANWCEPCKQFAKDYDALNQRVQTEKLPVRVAKYDCALDLEASFTKFKISSYPTFLFFIEGRGFFFQGQRSTDSLFNWMKQHISTPNPIEVLSQAQLNALLDENDFVLLYQCLDDLQADNNYWTFFEYSKTNSEALFVVGNLIKFGKPGGLYLYSKEFKERRTFQQAFTYNNIQRFLLVNQLPEVPQLDERSEKLIFQRDVTTFIFYGGHDPNSEAAEKAFHETAQLFKKTYQFIYSRVSDDKFFEQLTQFGGDDGVFPKIIAHYNGDKYIFNGPEFTVKSIKGFIFDFRQGKVNKHFKSEPVPEEKDQDSYVRKIVALNFKKEVFGAKKNVLVEYYADWCGACQAFKATYEQIAYELRNDPNLLVLKINAPLNDLQEFYQPPSYPDLVLYKSDGKIERFDNNDRSLQTVIDFVKLHTQDQKQSGQK